MRDGDPEAFAVLFEEHAGAIYRHALRMTGESATAEDVVSQTFLEAWKARARLRPGDDSEPLRPWLYGIATNVIRNLTRSARRRGAAMDRLPPLRNAPDFADEVVDNVVHGEQLGAARAALARLKRSEQEVLALVVWSDLSYAEAADALGIRVGTVKSRLARARNRLRSLAEEEIGRARSQNHQEIPEPARQFGQSPGGRIDTVRPMPNPLGRTS